MGWLRPDFPLIWMCCTMAFSQTIRRSPLPRIRELFPEFFESSDGYHATDTVVMSPQEPARSGGSEYIPSTSSMSILPEHSLSLHNQEEPRTRPLVRPPHQGGDSPGTVSHPTILSIAEASAPSASRSTQPPRRYVCSEPECKKSFVRPSSLRTHSYSHSGIKPFKCPLPGCTKKFSVRSNMKRHSETHQKSRHRSSLPPLSAATVSPTAHIHRPQLIVAQPVEQDSIPEIFRPSLSPLFVQGSSQDPGQAPLCARSTLHHHHHW